MTQLFQSLETLLGEFIDGGIGQIDPCFCDFRAFIEDTGGLAMCVDVSIALQKWFALHGIPSRLVGGMLNEVPEFQGVGYLDYAGEHWVLVVEVDSKWIGIDLTARQFDKNLPFPLIFGVIPLVNN